MTEEIVKTAEQLNTNILLNICLAKEDIFICTDSPEKFLEDKALFELQHTHSQWGRKGRIYMLTCCDKDPTQDPAYQSQWDILKAIAHIRNCPEIKQDNFRETIIIDNSVHFNDPNISDVCCHMHAVYCKRYIQHVVDNTTETLLPTLCKNLIDALQRMPVQRLVTKGKSVQQPYKNPCMTLE